MLPTTEKIFLGYEHRRTHQQSLLSHEQSNYILDAHPNWDCITPTQPNPTRSEVRHSTVLVSNPFDRVQPTARASKYTFRSNTVMSAEGQYHEPPAHQLHAGTTPLVPKDVPPGAAKTIPDDPAQAAMYKLLGSNLRCTLSDGRTATGTFICMDRL